MSAYFTSRIASRPLQRGDLIRMVKDGLHLVQYVNTSGAYAVSLSGNTRVINGREVNFVSDGTTISVNSAVEIVDPETLDDTCIERRRYDKMMAALGRVDSMAKKVKGAPLGDFDSSDVEGTPSGAQLMPDEVSTMAKKAVRKANGKANGNGETRKVRPCACGCGTETTSSFAPGHDARMHGWVKKLADGRIDGSGKDAKTGERIIPPGVLKSLDLKATKEGHRAQAPHFWRE